MRPELQFGVDRARRRRPRDRLPREAALRALDQRRLLLLRAGGVRLPARGQRARARAAGGAGRRRASCAPTGTRASGTAWTPTRTRCCSTTSGSAATRPGRCGPERSRLRHRRLRPARHLARAGAARARRRASSCCAATSRRASALRLDGLEERCEVVPGDVVRPWPSWSARSGDYEVDTVFHLAAQTIVGTANRSPLPTFETNIRGTWVLLEACRRHDVRARRRRRLRQGLRRHDELPYREDFALQPRFPYDVSQGGHRPDRALLLPHLRAAGGRDALRQPLRRRRPQPLAPGARGGGRRAPAAARPVIRSDGSPERDFLYVEDAAAAYLAIADALDGGRRARRGLQRRRRASRTRCSRSWSWSAGSRAPTWSPTSAGPGRRPARSTASTWTRRKLRELTGWEPRVSLEEGLRRTVEWYRAHPSCCPPQAQLRRHRVVSDLVTLASSPMSVDVCVIGLGRIGLPLALCFADRGLSRARRRQGRRAAGADRRAAHAVQGAGHGRADRARRRSGLSLPTRAGRRAGRRDRAHARHAGAAAHRDRHRRHPRGARRPAAAPARGPPARPALDGRARARPSSSPATSRSSAASGSARTSSSPTCPSGSPPTASWRRSARCRASSAASARAPASARRGCSSRSARRSCRPRRCRPSWRRSGPTSCATRRSRCPNLLMMDCERHGANVFDVIELINRDYPRGGMAQPGLTAGTCLRKDFTFSEERSSAPGDAARGLARARDRAAVPRRRRQAPARRIAARAPRGGARARLQARHRRRARLAVAQADPAARARAGRRRRCTTRVVATPTRSLRGRRRAAPTSSSSPPTTARTSTAGAAARDRRARRPRLPVVDPWNALGTAQVFAYVAEVAALRA